MRKVLFILPLVVLLLVGCTTADEKIPEIATDYCNCFSDVEKSLSSKTKEIMKIAVEAPDPEKVVEKEMEKLSEEERTKIGAEMSAIYSMGNKDSKVGKCVADVDKKYEKARTYNKEKFQDKLLKELESRPGCSFTAMMMKAVLSIKDEKE